MAIGHVPGERYRLGTRRVIFWEATWNQVVVENLLGIKWLESDWLGIKWLESDKVGDQVVGEKLAGDEVVVERLVVWGSSGSRVIGWGLNIVVE